MLATNAISEERKRATIVGKEELHFWLTDEQAGIDDTCYGSACIERKLLYNCILLDT
jgi:hypothetical protein